METKRTIYIGGCVMKKLMLICAPVTSRSGYGDHARDLVHSFIEHDKYDIKILDVRWGDCPRNALNSNSQKDLELINRILPKPQIDKQPDFYVDIRIPNEFQTPVAPKALHTTHVAKGSRVTPTVPGRPTV